MAVKNDDRLSRGDKVTVPFGKLRLAGVVVDTTYNRHGHQVVVSVAIDDDDNMISQYDELDLISTT